MNRIGFIAGILMAFCGLFLLTYTFFGGGGAALFVAILASAIAAIWMDSRGWFPR
jgi:hypothetical protein